MKKNRTLKNIKKLEILILSIFLILPSLVSAHCPLCTAAVGTGVAVTRFYGVDDSIVGLFLGAFIISSALWFNRWLKKKIKFPLQETLIVIFSFLLLAIPLYYKGIITNFDMVKSMPEHHSIFGLGVFGIDKLLFGMILGTLISWMVFYLDHSIKKKKRKVLFPYQGISFILISLVVLSFILWLIVK